MKRWWEGSLLALGLIALFSCGSGANIGEACKTAGSTSECVSGAICTNSSTALTCAKICTATSDCTGSQTCLGVSNTSIKSCQ